MKKVIIAIVGMASIGFAQAENKEKAATLYKEAIKLQKAGKYNAAYAKYGEANKLAPNNQAIRNSYIWLSRNKERLLKQQKQDQLKKVMIPKVDFDDESIEVALSKLSRIIQDLNETNKTNYMSNIVLRDTEKKIREKRITLSLNNVPLSVILDNILKPVNGQYKVEEYVIAVTPM